MPVNDVLEVRFAARSADQQNAFMVRHYRVATITGIEPTNAQYATALSQQAAIALKPCFSNQWIYWGCKVRRLTPNPTSDSISTASSGGGTLTPAVALPPQTSACISLRAGTAPPKTRGRVYMPPGESTSLSAGPVRWSAAHVTLLQTAGAFFIAGLLVTPVGGTSANIVAVLWSPKLSAAYDLTQSIVLTAPATQRRRANTTRTDAIPF